MKASSNKGNRRRRSCTWCFDEQLQRLKSCCSAARLVVACVLLLYLCAKPSRRCGEGGARVAPLSRQFDARPFQLSRRRPPGARARLRPLQRRAAPATGRARSHGGFVDSRAVRRRKGVLWRPPEARGSRGWGRRARNVSKKLTCCRQPRSRGRRLQGELSRTLYASPAVCSKLEFEDAGPHC